MVCPDWKYFDLERPSDFQLISSDEEFFFQNYPAKIIIDEAQQLPQLFSTLRSVVDDQRSVKGRFLITGSSSPEIIRGLSESLAGRVATIELSPMKCNELVNQSLPDFYSLLVNAEQQNIQAALLALTSPLSREQMISQWFSGGYPEPLLADDKEFYYYWMDNYIQNYLDRDIRKLFPRLNIQNYHRFLQLLSNLSCHHLVQSDIAKSIEISSSTVKDYLDIIHNTFLWRNLYSFEKNKKKSVQKMPKGFFRDSGLLHYLLKIKSHEDLLVHPIAGFSFESFVIEEIIRGLQATSATNLDYYHYRTRDKAEVDLIIDGFFGVIPVEVKLGVIIPKRSLKSMTVLLDDINAPLGIVVNNSTSIERLTEKIIQIPVNYL